MVLLQANLNEGAEAPSGVDSEMTAFNTELYIRGQYLIRTCRCGFFSTYNDCRVPLLGLSMVVELSTTDGAVAGLLLLISVRAYWKIWLLQRRR
jgi:hypothetical protein